MMNSNFLFKLNLTFWLIPIQEWMQVFHVFSGLCGNLYLRDLSLSETVQVTGLILNWISASDGNPANFITSYLLSWKVNLLYFDGTQSVQRVEMVAVQLPR